MATIKTMIEDIGLLIAGVQTVKGDQTLRDCKPDKYAPISDFGKWLEGTVKQTIKQTKLKQIREEFEGLLQILQANTDLISVAQNEVERLFIEQFGEENVQSNAFLDKVMGNSKISKLCVIAKENGICEVTVESLVNVALSNVITNKQPKTNNQFIIHEQLAFNF